MTQSHSQLDKRPSWVSEFEGADKGADDTGVYHPTENNYRCKYLINSKTIDPHQITNITDSY